MKIGFIGTGNMGAALATAVSKSDLKAELYFADFFAEKAKALAGALGGKSADNLTLVKECDIVFLGVKPQVLPELLAEISTEVKARNGALTLVTMAAGIPVSTIEKGIGEKTPVIRIMPNIPVKAGSGVVLYDATENVTEEAIQAFRGAMAGAGLVDRLPEKLIDAGSALRGCGPAFVALFAEALADGAVECGLPRDKAMRYALQTIAGTAEYLLETETHPAVLKDAVCSPGGSTIAGVHAMELGGFRAAAAEAVICAYQKTLELGK